MNAPWTFSAIFNVLSSMLDPNAAIKVQVNHGNRSDLLTELVAPEQLE